MILFDAEAFRSINNFAGRSSALDAVGVFCARWLIVVMFGAVIIRAAVALRRSSQRKYVALLAAAELRAVTAAAFAFIGNWLFSLLIFRPRPYVTLAGVHLLVPHPLTPYAFPSGHSSAAFALGFTMLLVDLPFGLLLLTCACAVAVGRVYVGVHYPGDVFAGMLVGLFWALVLHFVGTRAHGIAFLNRLLKFRTSRKR